MARVKKTNDTPTQSFAGLDPDLEVALNEMKKRWGNSVFIPGQEALEDRGTRLSTGILSFDRVLGGGFKAGLAHEIWGPEGCGKSTILLKLIASAQRKFPKKLVGLVDVEHSFDPAWAVKHGVDLNRLIFSQPLKGEEALEIIWDGASKGVFSLLGLDSIGGLNTDDMTEAHIEEGMSPLPRLMSKHLHRITAMAESTGTTTLWINQLREKPTNYGDPRKPMGGNAVKYLMSTRAGLDNAGKIKDRLDMICGHKVRMTTYKNKTFRPYLSTEVEFLYDRGDFSREGDAFDVGFDLGLVLKSGSWVTVPDLGLKLQGRETVIEYLVAHPEEYEKLISVITTAQEENSNATINVDEPVEQRDADAGSDS